MYAGKYFSVFSPQPFIYYQIKLSMDDDPGTTPMSEFHWQFLIVRWLELLSLMVGLEGGISLLVFVFLKPV